MQLVDGYWDVKQVAAYFGASPPSILRWARAGRLPAPVKIGAGRLTRWRVSEIIGHTFAVSAPGPIAD